MTDEWQVAGGSKRTRRKHVAAPPGASQDAAAAAATQGSPAPPSQYCSQQAPQLPGWGNSEQPASGFTYGASTRAKGGRRNQFTARTLDEEVDALVKQLEGIKFEVQRCQFYSRLKRAFATTSQHPMPSPSSSSPQATNKSMHVPAFDVTIECGSSAVVSQPDGAPQDSTGGVQGTAEVQHISPGDGWSTKIRHLVCWGLGSVQESRTSRYQMALLLLLSSELLPGLTSPPEVYDPAFTPVDRALMSRLGLTVAADNDQCRRPVTEPTVFFLPHLEGHMCDNLLASNLRGECLGQGQPGISGGHTSSNTLPYCVLLANSFSTYQHRWEVLGALKRDGKQQGSCCDVPGDQPSMQPKRPTTMLALLAAGAVVEVAVPQEANFTAPSAFNDTSLHLFKPNNAIFSPTIA